MNRRKILVTGASAGIGKAICLRVLQEGHRVVGVARDFRKFGERPERFDPVELDLSDLDLIADRLPDVAGEHADVDGLVLNAGRGLFGSLEELSFAQIRSLIDLNLTAQAFVARAFLPGIKRRGGGDLVFIGSEAALSGGRWGAVYAATKGALAALARALREEGAHSGIRVSVVHPGMVETGFYDRATFSPGEDAANRLLPAEVATAVWTALSCREGAVIDEIRLSPLKKVIRRKGTDTKR